MTKQSQKGGRAPRAATRLTNPESPLVASVVSDMTAEALLGMTPRAFREAVTRQNIPHVKLGARVVVAVEDLRELARATPSTTPTQAPLETADDMLAKIGYRRTA